MGDLPYVTLAERAVLVELCRPLLTGGLDSSPAKAREIAYRLWRGDSAIRQHLRNLYAAFGIDEDGTESRPARLARAAIDKGVVGPGDLA